MSLPSDASLWHGRDLAVDIILDYSAKASFRALLKRNTSQGIIQGVIIPCLGNIIGVILFLRLPWIVGRAGIRDAFGIVLVCCLCTLVTSLSFSAIATNGKVRGGGAYFIISHSLGPSLGAAVGLGFYLGISIKASMCFMGAVEAYERLAPAAQIHEPGDPSNVRITGSIILLLSLLFVCLRSRWVVKLGAFFLSVLFLSMFSMYIGCFVGPDVLGHQTYSVQVETEDRSLRLLWTGASDENLNANLGSAYDAPELAFIHDQKAYDFGSMMGLFFPSVTGMLAGSSHSADLTNPTRRLPRGTVFAQLLTSAIYLSFVIVLGSAAPRATLLNDKFFAATAAWPAPEVVMVGTIIATIGAGLTSIVTGSRLLTIIANDGTVPLLRFFVVTPGREPYFGYIATGIVCTGAMMTAQLDILAPILSMFFLMTYVCINMCCAISELVSEPNWRPRFRLIHWSISTLGVVGGVIMMYAISWYYAMLASIFVSVVFVLVQVHGPTAKWGDSIQAIKFTIARDLLMRLDQPPHTKNWRPQVLVATEISFSKKTRSEGDVPTTSIRKRLRDRLERIPGSRRITSTLSKIPVSRLRDWCKRPYRSFVSSEWAEGIIHRIQSYGMAVPLGGVRGTSKLVTVSTPEVLHLASQLQGGSGVTLVGGICCTEADELLSQEGVFISQEQKRKLPDVHMAMKQLLNRFEIEGFSRVVYAHDFAAGLNSLVQCAGLAAFQPNCVLVAWPHDWQSNERSRSQFVHTYRLSVTFDKALLVTKGTDWPHNDVRMRGFIDIWWLVGDGGLLLVLPLLLKKHNAWWGCRLRLFVCADTDGADQETLLMELNNYVKDFRLDFEVCLRMLDPNDSLCSSGHAFGRRQAIAMDDIHIDLDADVSDALKPSLPTDALSPSHETLSSGTFELRRTPEPSISSIAGRLTRSLAGGFNDMIMRDSAEADLVMISMPDMVEGSTVQSFYEMVETVTDGIARCLLVRGNSREAITAFH